MKLTSEKQCITCWKIPTQMIASSHQKQWSPERGVTHGFQIQKKKLQL